MTSSKAKGLLDETLEGFFIALKSLYLNSADLARYLLFLDFKYPITLDTAYFGGILIHTWMRLGMGVTSTIFIPFGFAQCLLQFWVLHFHHTIWNHFMGYVLFSCWLWSKLKGFLS